MRVRVTRKAFLNWVLCGVTFSMAALCIGFIVLLVHFSIDDITTEPPFHPDDQMPRLGRSYPERELRNILQRMDGQASLLFLDTGCGQCAQLWNDLKGSPDIAHAIPDLVLISSGDPPEGATARSVYDPLERIRAALGVRGVPTLLVVRGDRVSQELEGRERIEALLLSDTADAHARIVEGASL